MAPDDIPPGVKGDDYILRQIQTCDYFIMYVTDNYHKANFTEQEVGAAWAFKRRIIPFITRGTEVYGIAKTFQIKTIPELYNYTIGSFLLKLYGQFDSNDDFLDYLLEKELRASENFARSNTIHSLAEGLTENLNPKHTQLVLKSLWYNDQVRSTKWIPDLIKFLKSEQGFLSLHVDRYYKDETEKRFSCYLES